MEGYLLDANVYAACMTSTGYGGAPPLRVACERGGRRLNRRVGITIVDVDA